MHPSITDAVFWAAVVACLVAQVGILRATRSERDERARAAGPTHRAATRVEEVAWAVLPAVALVVVLALTWRAVQAHRVVAAPNAVATTGGAA